MVRRPPSRARSEPPNGTATLFQMRHLTRRDALLLPLALAACSEPEPAYEPLRYSYLPPIQLNVATIDVEQRFVPAGVPPDVAAQDPAPPVDALRAMASDRLQTFGTSGRAVFAILDAALTKEADVIRGAMAVSLTVYAPDGTQGGFAEARVEQVRSGQIDRLRPLLYDITKTMMDNMNVEFEYQVRRNLRAWLTSAAAPDTPVEQKPLDLPAQR